MFYYKGGELMNNVKPQSIKEGWERRDGVQKSRPPRPCSPNQTPKPNPPEK